MFGASADGALLASAEELEQHQFSFPVVLLGNTKAVRPPWTALARVKA
jgi:hypothetical protein